MGLFRVLLVGFVSACLFCAPAAAASAPVPRAKLLQMKHQIKGPVVVPAVGPSGYHFLSWKLLSATVPSAGQDWYSIMFKRGAKKLQWTVRVQSGLCAGPSDGHEGSVYWLVPGVTGQEAWRCMSAGRRQLVIDLFDFFPSPLLSHAREASILGSAHRA